MMRRRHWEDFMVVANAGLAKRLDRTRHLRGNLGV